MYLDDMPDTAPVRAIPGAGTKVPIWILGSSLYGAQLAAHLGLPYAFASHFAPALLEQALAIYRERFQPSEQLQEPYAMIAVGVCAADSDAEAEYLRSSQIQGFANIVTNKRGKLPLPTEDLASKVPSHTMHHVNKMLSCSAVGARDKLKSELSALIERHRPDELMVTGMIHDHPARVRSFDIAAEVLGELVER